MLFKLVMPHINRQIQGGAIIKWHKDEGEWVGYGDDLFDMNAISSFIEPDRVRTVSDRQAVTDLTEEETRARDLFLMPSMECFIRITSSDTGILLKICAGEGSRGEVGDLIAILGTDEDESIDRAEQRLDQASVFRVVANVIA